MTSPLTFGEIGPDKIYCIFCQNPLTTCKAQQIFILLSDHKNCINFFVNKYLKIKMNVPVQAHRQKQGL